MGEGRNFTVCRNRAAAVAAAARISTKKKRRLKRNKFISFAHDELVESAQPQIAIPVPSMHPKAQLDPVAVRHRSRTSRRRRSPNAVLPVWPARRALGVGSLATLSEPPPTT